MIKIKIYRNIAKNIYKFDIKGHSEFNVEGLDIVCSAVSILVLNTINCIEKFSNEKFECKADEENGGFIEFLLPDIKEGKKNHDVLLMLNVMVYGLYNIEKEYNQYIRIKEVF